MFTQLSISQRYIMRNFGYILILACFSQHNNLQNPCYTQVINVNNTDTHYS